MIGSEISRGDSLWDYVRFVKCTYDCKMIFKKPRWHVQTMFSLLWNLPEISLLPACIETSFRLSNADFSLICKRTKCKCNHSILSIIQFEVYNRQFKLYNPHLRSNCGFYCLKCIIDSLEVYSGQCEVYNRRFEVYNRQIQDYVLLTVWRV